MKLIQLNNLVKTFKDGDAYTRVLRGITLEIGQGEFVSIIGKSGTGKSTLLYQIGLLDNPTEGDIFIDGKNTSKLKASEKTDFRLRNYGFVFQDYALIPELSAIENVALSEIALGNTKTDAYKKAEEALDYFGLGNLKNKYPSQLSGGENQRVAIARAIVHKPRIIFADEPTANLDESTSRPVIDIFSKLHKDGNTIIMVTHEIEYAKEADRMLHLRDGVVWKDEDLKNQRQNNI